jgi:hypothetical protein
LPAAGLAGRTRASVSAAWIGRTAPQRAHGNAGRNILFGPGTRNLDVKFGKSFSFRERWKPEFRAELFNAFNTPNFLAPNPNVDLPQGGQITSAKSARDIQLGMKLVF